MALRLRNIANLRSGFQMEMSAVNFSFANFWNRRTFFAFMREIGRLKRPLAFPLAFHLRQCIKNVNRCRVTRGYEHWTAPFRVPCM